jgi:hypothetical protein
MYNICHNSLWIKSYDPWSFDPPIPGLWEKILVGTHLKKSTQLIKIIWTQFRSLDRWLCLIGVGIGVCWCNWVQNYVPRIVIV